MSKVPEPEDEFDIVQAVIDHVLDEEDFEETALQWAKERCHVFDLTTDEMKFEYSDLHKQFQDFFEAQLESFIKSKGCSIEDFYQALKEKIAAEPEGEASEFLKSILAVVEFDVFVQMMQDVKANGYFTDA